MENCIFCKIVRGEIPHGKVYEDENTFAFLDSTPVNIGHTLVIPKKHFQDIYETPEETMAEIMKTAKKIAESVKKAVGADGINLHMNNEEAAGQKVFHTHLHIIPRLKDDGFGPWHGKRLYEDGEMTIVAEKIIAGL